MRFISTIAMLQDPFIDRADDFGQVLARLLAERFPLLSCLGALCSQLMLNLLLFVLHRLRILCAIFNGGGAFLLRDGGFDGFHNIACLTLRSLADFVCLRLRLLDSFHDFQRQSIHPLSG